MKSLLQRLCCAGSAALIALPLLLMPSCNRGGSTQNNGGNSPDTTAASPQSASLFNADSAYSYVARQVAFGPRVPNTPAHRECADWIAATLRARGLSVTEQHFTATAWDGTSLALTNIIGQINPSAPKRILLMAHWDTRPWADKDPVNANHTKPIDGADDAGSGVGVLLELARYYAQNTPAVGLDFVFFDGEDYGRYEDEESWCLGSTYFSKNPFTPGYKAQWGILLDMVGAADARFSIEGFSYRYATSYVNLVWDTAQNLGYGAYFSNAQGGYITDDHVPVIRNMVIPCIDILNFSAERANGFPHHWHTVNDTMEAVSAQTLGVVGHTLMEVINKQ